ncbi:Uncharacterised protein [Vibrio cholerae]|nr:Uncharacterised protein [Vibrio cholerae]
MLYSRSHQSQFETHWRRVFRWPFAACLHPRTQFQPTPSLRGDAEY